MKPVILYVATDIQANADLLFELVRDGFDVIPARDYGDAARQIGNQIVNLVISKLTPPYWPSLEACRRFRDGLGAACPPTIILISRISEFDRLDELHTGAEDFLVEPFETGELTARIRAILRRSEPAFANDVIELGKLKMNLATHRATLDGRPVDLRPAEFRILRFLMENPNRVFSRDQLISRVWGNNIHIGARTVDVHIRRLRKALNRPDSEDLIRTVRAVGYALEFPEPATGSRQSTRLAKDGHHEIRGSA